MTKLQVHEEDKMALIKSVKFLLTRLLSRVVVYSGLENTYFRALSLLAHPIQLINTFIRSLMDSGHSSQLFRKD